MDLETDARFQCPRCEDDVAANVLLPEFNWRDEGAFSDVEIVVVICPFCRENFKARAFATASMCRLEFIDHPLTPISASPPMVRGIDEDIDDWLYDTPADPYSIFNTSLAEARFLLDQHGGDGASLLNRMVFTHYIGAFEAYLADTLINEVLPNEPALKRLIERDKELRKLQFSLSEIAASPELIKDEVRKRLRAQVWHRIDDANALYAISFGIDIRAMLGSDNEIVDQAVHLRHDCVHRNGRDKEGNDLTDFTKEYVVGLGGILSRLVHDIQKAFNERRAASFFGGTTS